MPAPRRYPAELRQRAVRLVLETRDQQPGETVPGALLRGRPSAGSQPGHVARLGPPGGDRPEQPSWVSTADSARVKELERELPQPGGPRPHLGCAYAGGAIEMGPRWLTPTTCAA
jgi:transposase